MHRHQPPRRAALRAHQQRLGVCVHSRAMPDMCLRMQPSPPSRAQRARGLAARHVSVSGAFFGMLADTRQWETRA